MRLTEPAEVEVEAEYARLADLFARVRRRWCDGLLAEIAKLTEIGQVALFPAPHEVAPENDPFDVEVRCLLYFGPAKRRRAASSCRVLFYVVEPLPGEAQWLVRVLHVWHGAQRPRR